MDTSKAIRVLRDHSFVVSRFRNKWRLKYASVTNATNELVSANTLIKLATAILKKRGEGRRDGRSSI